jgi:hypothetical protein
MSGVLCFNRRSGQNSLSVCAYYASSPLQAGKTVTWIVLPTVNTSVFSGEPSLHVFAAWTGLTPMYGARCERSAL